MPLAITASLSASALSGKTTFDANCAGCHSLGIYDATGSPNLGGLGAATLTTALNARFAGGISHNGRTLTAPLITDMLNFLSLY
jgi:mono/diheme cytochrome c family protein